MGQHPVQQVLIHSQILRIYISIYSHDCQLGAPIISIYLWLSPPSAPLLPAIVFLPQFRSDFPDNRSISGLHFWLGKAQLKLSSKPFKSNVGYMLDIYIYTIYILYIYIHYIYTIYICSSFDPMGLFLLVITSTRRSHEPGWEVYNERVEACPQLLGYVQRTLPLRPIHQDRCKKGFQQQRNGNVAFGFRNGSKWGWHLFWLGWT